MFFGKTVSQNVVPRTIDSTTISSLVDLNKMSQSFTSHPFDLLNGGNLSNLETILFNRHMATRQN